MDGKIHVVGGQFFFPGRGRATVYGTVYSTVYSAVDWGRRVTTYGIMGGAAVYSTVGGVDFLILAVYGAVG